MGVIEDIRALLKEYEIPFNVEDKRFAGKAIDCNFKGSLNDAQEEALK